MDVRSTTRPSAARRAATRRLVGVTAASLAALVAAGTLAGPSYADSMSTPDAADAASPFDLTKVAANHGSSRLVTNVVVADLDLEGDAGPASMSLFVDTDPSARGPEFRLAVGLDAGSDYQLVRMRSWRPVGNPLTCGHRVSLQPAHTRVVFRIDNDCVGKPDSLRVGVKMVDHHDASHPVVDWFKGVRAWTRWLDRG